MELKAILGALTVTLSPFQSHLYGIERSYKGLRQMALKVSIAPLWNWKRLTEQIRNVGYIVSIAPLWNWKETSSRYISGRVSFQSHLYGIERSIFPRLSRQLQGVSIAPLWNWKMDVKLSLFRSPLFQSHLYGIESCYWLAYCWFCLCFNRTFMELKEGSASHAKRS